MHDHFHERQNEGLLAPLVALEDVRRKAAVPRPVSYTHLDVYKRQTEAQGDGVSGEGGIVRSAWAWDGSPGGGLGPPLRSDHH